MLAYLMTASVPQCAFRAATEPTLYSNLVTSQTGASGYARRHNDEDDHEDHNNDGGDGGDGGEGSVGEVEDKQGE